MHAHRLFEFSERLRGIALAPRLLGAATLVLGALMAQRGLFSGTLPYPYLVPFLAALATTALFGRGPGLMAAALGAGYVAWRKMERAGSAPLLPGEDALATALYLPLAAAAVWMFDTQHRTHAAVLAAQQEAEEARRRAEAGEREKELLLGELSHRVRNDLQRVMALLGAQAGRMRDPAAAEALRDAAGRLRVLGQLHERLGLRGGEVLVDSQRFLEKLVEDLCLTSGAGRDGPAVAFAVEAEPHPLPLATASDVGLVANELVTNALKYAFPDGQPGTVRVRFAREGGEFVLAVSDDGAGAALAENSSPPPGSGQGTRVLHALAAQLGGSFCRRGGEGGSGTAAELRFPSEAPENRGGGAADPARGTGTAARS